MGLTLKIKLFAENEVPAKQQRTTDTRPLEAGYRCGTHSPSGHAEPNAAGNQAGPSAEMGAVLQKLRALAMQVPTGNKASTYRHLLEELDGLVKAHKDPPLPPPTYLRFADFKSNELTQNIRREQQNFRINVRHEAGDEEATSKTGDNDRDKVIDLATHLSSIRRGQMENRERQVSTDRNTHAPMLHSHSAASIQDLMTRHLQQMQIQSQNYASCAMQNTVNIAGQLAELAERFSQSGHPSIPKDITLSLLR